MKKVYLDNAATTQMRVEVIESMLDSMQNNFGNPSSTHSFGRSAKNSIETSRKLIAKYLNCNSQETIFTSGATESINLILERVVLDLKITRIITTKIEHHAVLYKVEQLKKVYNIQVDYLKIDENGAVNFAALNELLSSNQPTIVALMHINNETGVYLDIETTARICKQNNAFFFSDTVQSMAKTTLDLSKIEVDFLVASAHKFHGPKGCGFVFVRKGINIKPEIIGGEQEKGLRAGTESVHNIVGMAKAFEIAIENHTVEEKYITELKDYTIAQLLKKYPDLIINGKDTFYNILNVSLPISVDKASMLLFGLDMKGIAVSRGSACQSGSSKPSHVLAEMLNDEDILLPNLRISFSHFNTKEDVDFLIENL